jgi:uncharacterized membrane protein YkvA (DUF1232 family)
VKLLERWKTRARELKREIHALALACKDPRVPWPAKLLAAGVVGYALSPIDLIPDFIPVLGYLDDLLLVPLGIYFVMRMIPAEVLTECRRRANDTPLSAKSNWIAAAFIITVWLVFGVWLLRILKVL